MIFEFLKKQKETKKKISLIKIMIKSVNIPDTQKELYIDSLDILSIDRLNNLYNDLINLTKINEFKNLEDINKQNFSTINWLRKKEAVEKQKEINAFSFLLHNL